MIGNNPSNFCMTKDSSGMACYMHGLYHMHHAGCWKLSREYSYYYQVQVQQNVYILCKYGYFVVWTEGEIAMERITIDKEFYKMPQTE